MTVPELKCDFSGWATKNDLKCTDGRVIKHGAFKDNEGEFVPLVWGHNHSDPEFILGRMLLKNFPEGTYGYGFLNNNPKAQEARELLAHGDITRMSIWAGDLQHNVNEVVHGRIKEVSLVVGACNPGARIEKVYIAHGDGEGDVLDDEGIIFFEEDLNVEMMHADEPAKEDTKKKTEEDDSDDDDPEAVYESMNDKQKDLVLALVGYGIAAGKSDAEEEADDDKEVKHSEGGETEMKYNTFDTGAERNTGNFISHEDQAMILEMAKDRGVGSFQNAFRIYAEQNELQHSDEPDPVGGFKQIGTTYNIDALFPDYKEAHGPQNPPQLITSDQGWINTVLNKVHKSPISRIRTSHVDIRKIDELRAKGFQKGKKKTLSGNFEMVRRTTDPQTIYVRNALYRDDIIDITDFDYVNYLYQIDKMMLNEELATAIMIGDGRALSSDDKIFEDKIRPIWTDDDLYTIHRDLDVDNSELQGTETEGYFGENYILAETLIETVLYAREDFKGTGTPDLFLTPHMLNVMLLSRDRNGRRIFSNKNELASSLNVAGIYTAEQFADKTCTRVVNGVSRTKQLQAIICNLADYSLGATKGGEVTHFTQFDIDFNQQKSLLETRCSGALTRLWSAIAIETDLTA